MAEKIRTAGKYLRVLKKSGAKSPLEARKNHARGIHPTALKRAEIAKKLKAPAIVVREHSQ